MTKEFHCRESKPMAESPMPQKYVKNLATSQTMKNRENAAVGFPNIERAPPIHPAVFFFLSQLSAVWPARFIQKKAHIWPFSHKVWSIGLVPLRNINKKKNTSCTLVHGISFKSSPRGLWRHPDVWFPSAGPHSRLCTALRFAPQASVSQKWIEQTLCYLDRGYWRCFIYTWGFPSLGVPPKFLGL